MKNNVKINKKSIIKWAERNGRLPNRRKPKSEIEKLYAYKMENYLSPKSKSFDFEFRKYIFENFNRRVNNKHSHNKQERIEELKAFIRKNNRLPRTRSCLSNNDKEEHRIRSILDNYAGKTSSLFDQDLYNFVKKIDVNYGNSSLAIEKRRYGFKTRLLAWIYR